MWSNNRIKLCLCSTLNFGVDDHHEKKSFRPTRHLKIGRKIKCHCVNRRKFRIGVHIQYPTPRHTLQLRKTSMHSVRHRSVIHSLRRVGQRKVGQFFPPFGPMLASAYTFRIKVRKTNHPLNHELKWKIGLIHVHLPVLRSCFLETSAREPGRDIFY